MYSVFFSRIEMGMDLVKKDLINILPKNPKVAFLPWAFPVEIDAYKLEKEFFKKVTHDTEILYDIKHFEGLVIGESAGTELQLTRYFITAKNNFYKYFAFYDGFGLINDPFYMDVHAINNKRYLDS